jgi:hypothetical protein
MHLLLILPFSSLATYSHILGPLVWLAVPPASGQSGLGGSGHLLLRVHRPGPPSAAGGAVLITPTRPSSAPSAWDCWACVPGLSLCCVSWAGVLRALYRQRRATATVSGIPGRTQYPILKVTEIYNKVTELYNFVTELEIRAGMFYVFSGPK